jgi:hypothetical protein
MQWFRTDTFKEATKRARSGPEAGHGRWSGLLLAENQQPRPEAYGRPKQHQYARGAHAHGHTRGQPRSIATTGKCSTLACLHVLTSTTRYVAFHGPDHDLDIKPAPHRCPHGNSEKSKCGQTVHRADCGEDQRPGAGHPAPKPYREWCVRAETLSDAAWPFTTGRGSRNASRSRWRDSR